jgi:YesN/AraC family two-component response regulator
MKAALYLFASTAFDCSPFAAVDEPASDSIDVLLAQIHRLERASLVRLLEIFAEHLSLMATQIPLHERNGDSRIVSLAKDYIADHKSDPIKFEQIARAINVSTFHFCRRFKLETGLTFVEYLSRVRIEQGKLLLRTRSYA